MAMCALIAILVLFLNRRVLGDQSEENLNYTFPEGFMFGAATSAYQIEGAWNVDGKGPSVWDNVSHNFPGYIIDNSTADEAALSYYLYKEDTKALKDMGITLFHWDTPQYLQDLGGWANEFIVKVFVEYARVVFKNFGDRRLMPTHDVKLGWFAEPIFGNGDFPEVMKKRVKDSSTKQGFPWSRLPEFSPEERQLVKGTYDYFALNHYTTNLVTPAQPKPQPSFLSDQGVQELLPWWLPASNTSKWLFVSPQGFRRLLRLIKQRYGDVQICITENGFADSGELEDEMKMTYIGTYMTEMYKAMYIDGVNVIGYTVWSVIDNMEWRAGYTSKFGLYHVNFTDPARPRIPKASSYMMKEITSTRKIPQKYVDLAATFSLDIRPKKNDLS
ncbi:hypothetical protein ANN_10553 [Periplaneta americana]|uniref:Uncharacterized protein n=1 Tax=Periplaneta americana TaxID=6978 RepID=A0ABQ8TS43_PERAM|nr:hypothetical protein ANN_10553 [Periplaneta americana]